MSFIQRLRVVKQSLIPDNTTIIDQAIVSKLFKLVNVNKCSGPDGICGKTLKFCADQLSGVFQHLFQTFVDTCIVPAIWKLSTVIPIPKKDNPKLPIDFWPVALTSLVMTTLEKITKSIMLTVTECNLGPLQLRIGGVWVWMEDAKLFILNALYKYLEWYHTRARILFAGISSAFNTMQPHLLVYKLLSNFGLKNHIVL